MKWKLKTGQKESWNENRYFLEKWRTNVKMNSFILFVLSIIYIVLVVIILLIYISLVIYVISKVIEYFR